MLVTGAYLALTFLNEDYLILAWLVSLEYFSELVKRYYLYISKFFLDYSSEPLMILDLKIVDLTNIA